MSDWLMRVIKAEAKQLIALAAEDEELRADLRALANEILAATEDPGCRGRIRSRRTRGFGDSRPGRARNRQREMVEPLRELTLGRSAPPKSEPRAEFGSRFACVSRRTMSLRKSKQIAGGRERRPAGPRSDCFESGRGMTAVSWIAPMDPEMAEWASKLTDCFCLGAGFGSRQRRPIFRCSTTWGAASRHWPRRLRPSSDVIAKNQGSKAIDRMLPLVAEAQSALRAALKRLGASDDPDQLEVFEWVKTTAARQHVYLKRFMRADDVANPAGWSELIVRIEAHRAERSALAANRLLTSSRSEIRSHESRMAKDVEQDWQAVVQIVDELVEGGVPAEQPGNPRVLCCL